MATLQVAAVNQQMLAAIKQAAVEAAATEQRVAQAQAQANDWRAQASALNTILPQLLKPAAPVQIVEPMQSGDAPRVNCSCASCEKWQESCVVCNKSPSVIIVSAHRHHQGLLSTNSMHNNSSVSREWRH